MATWFDVTAESEGWSLIDTGRMRRIIDDMNRPSIQYPTVLFCIGNTVKVQALRALFPDNNITRCTAAGLVRLHLSTRTAASAHPVLLLEGNPPGRRRSRESDSHRRASTARHRYPIRTYGAPNDDKLQHRLYGQLLLPFTHVLCVFADDFPNWDSVHDFLAIAAVHMEAVAPLDDVRPQVVIVLTDPSQNACHDLDLTDRLMPPDIVKHYAAPPTILDLRHRHELSPAAAFEPLRSTLLEEVGRARQARIDSHMLLSAKHLDALLDQATCHVVKEPDMKFDCIRAARENNIVDEAVSDHISEFLRQSDRAGLSDEEVHSFIGSALLMDAYPPQMHSKSSFSVRMPPCIFVVRRVSCHNDTPWACCRKPCYLKYVKPGLDVTVDLTNVVFGPATMFERLYAHHCQSAWIAKSNLDPDYHCREVEKVFVSLFACLSGKPSAKIRQETLASAAGRWSKLRTSDICLFCLRRPPGPTRLPCGHAICDTCVVIFGVLARGSEYQFNVPQCILCHEPCSTTVRILPPTKRPIVLVLDGGGVRGMVTLGFLRALERRWAGQIDPRQDIDLTVGTSAVSQTKWYDTGGVNALEWIVEGTPIDVAIQKYHILAQRIFSGRPSNPGWLSRSWNALRNWFADGQYDSAVLDEALKETFGVERHMFDVPASLPAGSRVAVTTSRISDGKLCLLANYRRQGASSGYQFLVSRDGAREPLLWEAARCSVAAPMFFSAQYLPGFGPMQDGGLRANNPVLIALRESTIVWPSRGRFDILISVGTGFKPLASDQEDTPSRSILYDGFIPRLLRSFWFSPAMDGEEGWNSALDVLPEEQRADSHRLNRPLGDNIPGLDAAERLTELRDLPYTIPDDVAQAFLAAGFLFELDELPTDTKGGHQCRGSILSTRPNAYASVECALKEFPGACFAMLDGASLGRVDDDDGCRVCGYYCKRVTFRVTSLHETLVLVIASRWRHRRIAGFPNSIQWFLDRQQASSVFGRSDHRTDCWPPARSCYCVLGSKRRVHFVEPPPELKKPRL